MLSARDITQHCQSRTLFNVRLEHRSARAEAEAARLTHSPDAQHAARSIDRTRRCLEARGSMSEHRSSVGRARACTTKGGCLPQLQRQRTVCCRPTLENRRRICRKIRMSETAEGEQNPEIGKDVVLGSRTHTIAKMSSAASRSTSITTIEASQSLSDATCSTTIDAIVTFHVLF